MIFRSSAAALLVTIITTTTLFVVHAANTDPPPFFLQDPSDSLCLAGELFQRCGLDTLFYVEGSPGKYNIHKRPIDAKDNDETCLVKKSCKETDFVDTLKLGKCSHCGAHNWNILGDADSGYVLTVNEKICVVREPKTNKATTVNCDNEEIDYTALQLRFASNKDIEAMSSPGARMVAAASDGDKKALQNLLKDNDVDTRNWDGLTALIPASSGGHLDVVKFLIHSNADINAHDNDGITALMEASIMGHPKVVDVLIEKGATVEATASSEVTALWLAASEGKVECMKSLIKNGASASNTRSDGITALMTASVGGHTEAVKLLLENGADATATDKDGLTALMNAAEKGNVEVLKLLTQAANKDADYLNAVSTTGFTALIIASAHGHTDAVSHLLQEGADVDAAADSAVTALMYAAASDHVDTVKVLIGAGANLEMKHSNGGTALLEAATGGAAKAIKLLIEKGAVYDSVDDDGVTPLMAIASNGSVEGQQVIVGALKKKLSDSELKDHINLFSKSGGSTVMFATAGGHLENTKQLVSLGADIHAIARATPDYLEKLEEMIAAGTVNPDDDPHVDGVTALHVAAQGGHLEVVDYLIEQKVDVSVADDAGRTPLTLAIKGSYSNVASSLVEAGANPNTKYVDDKGVEHNLLFDAIALENDEFSKLLIENGADLFYKDEKKVSTLLQASHRGLTAITKSLLEKYGKKGGAFIDDASEEGISPLIAASSEGHVEVVKLLVAAKADVNVVDKDKTSALMAASARGHLDVVKELIAAGAKVNEQNTDGHTALMFAYNGKNQVETLWERYNQYVNEAEEPEADDAGTGALIRDALDKHLSLIDDLMKNGADSSLKDKEGHTAKDFDYHPDADAEVLGKEAKAAKVRDESKNEL